MGNCALKPKVLSGTGAPAPEELKDSLLEDHKNDAAKSLSNLFLQDKVEKTTKEEEKITPEKMPVIEDLKTALAKVKSPTTDAKSPTTEEAKYPTTEEAESPTTVEAKSPTTEEAKSPTTEEANSPTVVESPETATESSVDEKKVIDDVTAKETETEVKPEEVKAQMKQA